MIRPLSISATASKSRRKVCGVIQHSLCLLLAFGLHSATARAETLGGLLDQTGKQVLQFWSYFPSVTCTESLTQTKIGPKGKKLFEQSETFDYLITLQTSGLDISVDESRLQKLRKVSKGKASLLETNGFAILSAIFHPLYQSHFEFRRLTDDSLEGRTLLRIAFQQVAQDHPLSVLLLREREYPLSWSGTAWIDPRSGAVVRMQAGLGKSMQDTGLLRLDADVTYAEVAFNGATSYWLPARAVIEAETKRQHWRNTHLFTNYRRFDVETQVKTALPQ